MAHALRSVHSLEFGKHGPSGVGVDDGAVPALHRKGLLFHFHRLLLAPLRGPLLQRPRGRSFFLQSEDFRLEGELIDVLGMCDGSELVRVYLRVGSEGTHKFYMKLCIFLMGL